MRKKILFLLKKKRGDERGMRNPHREKRKEKTPTGTRHPARGQKQSPITPPQTHPTMLSQSLETQESLIWNAIIAFATPRPEYN